MLGIGKVLDLINIWPASIDLKTFMWFIDLAVVEILITYFFYLATSSSKIEQLTWSETFQLSRFTLSGSLFVSINASFSETSFSFCVMRTKEIFSIYYYLKINWIIYRANNYFLYRCVCAYYIYYYRHSRCILHTLYLFNQDLPLSSVLVRDKPNEFRNRPWWQTSPRRKIKTRQTR